MQWPPSPELTGLIKHYLLLEKKENRSSAYRLFSDGNPGLVFHFEQPLLQKENNATFIQPKSFLYGQATHFNDLFSTGAMVTLIVVLQPYGIFSLLKEKAAEWNDRIVALQDLSGRYASFCSEQNGPADHLISFIQSLESFLKKNVLYENGPDAVIQDALLCIHQVHGNIRIEQLLKQIPVTERQLERKFNQFIGITPKKYADIVRFQYLLKRLRQTYSRTRISDGIYESGYYDPSHLNGYFKKATGLTPREYRQNSLLASNLMQMPAEI